MNARIHVADCRHGKGVFARTPIRAWEEILRFTGPLIGLKAVAAKGERQYDALQVGPAGYRDIGCPGVLVNHSCEPNAGIVDDSVLVAIADIRAGEEICYDYSTTMDEDFWTLSCTCGSPACRHIVGDFKNLPREIRLRYLKIGVVQAFIARQFSDCGDPLTDASGVSAGGQPVGALPECI